MFSPSKDSNPPILPGIYQYRPVRLHLRINKQVRNHRFACVLPIEMHPIRWTSFIRIHRGSGHEGHVLHSCPAISLVYQGLLRPHLRRHLIQLIHSPHTQKKLHNSHVGTRETQMLALRNQKGHQYIKGLEGNLID